MTPESIPVLLSSSSTWMETIWNAAQTVRRFSAHQYTPLSREDAWLMVMLKPLLVFSRVKEPLVFLGDRVCKISSQVTLFSLQKKSSNWGLLFGYLHVMVAAAALLTV